MIMPSSGPRLYFLRSLAEDGVFGLLGAVAGKDEVALRFDGCSVFWAAKKCALLGS